LTNANTTTFISDSITITGGMAISENSRFVYTTEQYHVYQYDLNAADVWSSRTLIEIWDGYYNGDHPGFFWANFGRAQLAPDGKIYVATPGSGRQYHIIHNPNKRGAASNFEQRGLPFTQWNNRSIPNFPYYGLGPWDGSPCDTLNIDNPVPEARYEHTQDSSASQLEFFDASHYAYEWSWDFGDGSAVSTEQHPVHTFPASGTYQVCLQVSNVTGQDVYCEEIYVGVVATANPMSENLRVQVYPNPTQGDLSLIGGDISLVEKISLLDINGKRVTEWSGEIQHGLKLPAELVDGVYLLRIQEIDGILQTIKIIISN
jgi:PKD repeat protein